MNYFKQSSATREDLGLLAVMEVLDDEGQVTQRELSRRTGLNLRKVNYCLHKLLEKGHVKFQRVVSNPDKRAYLYILTPTGLKAKSHLTYFFLKFTLDFYNQVEEKLRFCLARMEAAGVERIMLYGASEAARVVLELIEGNCLEVVGVLDKQLVEDEFCGLPVLRDESLREVEWDGVLITVLEGVAEVEGKLFDVGISEERIWRL